MANSNLYCYTWNNDNGSLVFEFTIPSGTPPEYMTLYLYSKKNTSSKVFRESCDGQIIFANVNINGKPLNGRVWLNNSGSEHGYIETDLDYGLPPLDQNLAGAVVEYFYQPGPPVPPPIPPVPPLPPPVPTPADQWETAAVSVDQKAAPLFPFIDVQGWPALPAEEQNLHFIIYPWPATPPSSPAPNSFFYILNQDKTRGDMEASAVSWVEGPSFISNANQLTGPIAHFSRLDLIIERAAKYDPWAVLDWIAWELKTNRAEILAYISSPEYLQMRDEVWQSWFALVVLNGGYRPDVFRMLTRTIVFCNFTETIVTDFHAAQISKENKKITEKTKEQNEKDQQEETEQEEKAPVVPPVLSIASPGIRTVKDLLHASILLQSPSRLAPFPFPFPVSFPLPPDAVTTPLSIPSWEKGWVAPYAVGRLKLVNKKLIGYRGGDLAHIENVMRGEKRETKKRKLSRTEEKESRKESNFREQSGSSSETKNNFEQEARKAAAESFTQFKYDNLNSTYGAPNTFTLTGSWEKVQGNNLPAQSSASGFAEYIITKTVQRMKRQVDEQRQRVHLDESEESTSSVFDNTLGTQNLHGVYRWLNNVYEARIVNYGSRLLLEFMVKHPAKTFIAECKRLYGVDLKRPKTLHHFDINTYHDIVFPKPKSEELVAAPAPAQPQVEKALLYFGINDWPLQPVAEKIISIVLQSGQRLNIPLPEGYAATKAVITLPLTITTAQLAVPLFNGILGQSTFDNTSVQTNPAASGKERDDDPPAFTPFLNVDLHGETESIAAVLFDIYAPQQADITGLPPIPTPPAAPEAGVVSNAGLIASSTLNDEHTKMAAHEIQFTDDPPPVTAPTPPPVIDEVAVSVTITCTRTDETLTRWQMRIFQLLDEAEKLKQEKYNDLLTSTRENGARWIPPDLSSLERLALQQDCTDRLFEIFYSLTGVPAEPLDTNTPGTFMIYQPAISQFFNDAMEWNELSYALATDIFHKHQPGTMANQEQLPGDNLSAFIQAEYARVLVPVNPLMSLPVLYFLATGNVWQGPPEEVPVAAQSLLAAFAVKTERPQAYHQSESLPWTFEVPTAMLMLEDRNDIFISVNPDKNLHRHDQ